MTESVLYHQEPELAAKAAKLRYVSDDEPGYVRKPWGRGFTYRDADGAVVTDEALKQRFEELVIPPNWQDVWICKTKNGHIQATGRDAKGRKQYLYHAQWVAVRDRAKFDTLILFAENLPALRKQVEADLQAPCLSKEHVTAAIIKLLEHTLIRVGNDSYAKNNKTYGLTTLRNKHVRVEGKKLRFSFVGKSGKAHEIGFEDKQLADAVRACSELPGYRVFQYLDEDDARQTIDSSDVNAYLKAHMGEYFSAKDFRTWAASVLTASFLRDVAEDDADVPKEKQVTTVIKQVAEALGNTPAVCRSSYVHPLIPELFLEGAFVPAFNQARKGRLKAYMQRDEKALLKVLKSHV